MGGGTFVWGTCAQGSVSIRIEYALDDRRIGIGLVAVSSDTSLSVSKSIKTDGGNHSVSCTMGTGRTMAQAVNRRFPTVQARVRSQVSGYICGGQGGAGTGFSPNISGFPCLYRSTNAPYSCSAKPYGCRRRSSTRSGIGEHWIDKNMAVTGWCFPRSNAHLACS